MSMGHTGTPPSNPSSLLPSLPQNRDSPNLVLVAVAVEDAPEVPLLPFVLGGAHGLHRH